jgi:hypothetical protein
VPEDISVSWHRHGFTVAKVHALNSEKSNLPEARSEKREGHVPLLIGPYSVRCILAEGQEKQTLTQEKGSNARHCNKV